MRGDKSVPDTNCYLPTDADIAEVTARLRAAHLERKRLSEPPSDKVSLRDEYQVQHWPAGKG